MNTVRCTSLDISQMAQMFMAQGQPTLEQTSAKSPDKDISVCLSYLKKKKKSCILKRTGEDVSSVSLTNNRRLMIQRQT